MRDVIMHQKKMEKKHHIFFYNTFNRKLSEFMEFMTGFDIVAFDDYLKVPDGVSLKDYIREKHGDDAVTMIEALISSP